MTAVPKRLAITIEGIDLETDFFSEDLRLKHRADRARKKKEAKALRRQLQQQVNLAQLEAPVPAGPLIADSDDHSPFEDAAAGTDTVSYTGESNNHNNNINNNSNNSNKSSGYSPSITLDRGEVNNNVNSPAASLGTSPDQHTTAENIATATQQQQQHFKRHVSIVVSPSQKTWYDGDQLAEIESEGSDSSNGSSISSSISSSSSSSKRESRRNSQSHLKGDWGSSDEDSEALVEEGEMILASRLVSPLSVISTGSGGKAPVVANSTGDEEVLTAMNAHNAATTGETTDDAGKPVLEGMSTQQEVAKTSSTTATPPVSPPESGNNIVLGPNGSTLTVAANTITNGATLNDVTSATMAPLLTSNTAPIVEIVDDTAVKAETPTLAAAELLQTDAILMTQALEGRSNIITSDTDSSISSTASLITRQQQVQEKVRTRRRKDERRKKHRRRCIKAAMKLIKAGKEPMPDDAGTPAGVAIMYHDLMECMNGGSHNHSAGSVSTHPNTTTQRPPYKSVLRKACHLPQMLHMKDSDSCRPPSIRESSIGATASISSAQSPQKAVAKRTSIRRAKIPPMAVEIKTNNENEKEKAVYPLDSIVKNAPSHEDKPEKKDSTAPASNSCSLKDRVEAPPPLEPVTSINHTRDALKEREAELAVKTPIMELMSGSGNPNNEGELTDDETDEESGESSENEEQVTPQVAVLPTAADLTLEQRAQRQRELSNKIVAAFLEARGFAVPKPPSPPLPPLPYYTGDKRLPEIPEMESISDDSSAKEDGSGGNNISTVTVNTTNAGGLSSPSHNQQSQQQSMVNNSSVAFSPGVNNSYYYNNNNSYFGLGGLGSMRDFHTSGMSNASMIFQQQSTARTIKPREFTVYCAMMLRGLPLPEAISQHISYITTEARKLYRAAAKKEIARMKRAQRVYREQQQQILQYLVNKQRRAASASGAMSPRSMSNLLARRSSSSSPILGRLGGFFGSGRDDKTSGKTSSISAAKPTPLTNITGSAGTGSSLTSPCVSPSLRRLGGRGKDKDANKPLPPFAIRIRLTNYSVVKGVDIVENTLKQLFWGAEAVSATTEGTSSAGGTAGVPPTTKTTQYDYRWMLPGGEAQLTELVKDHIIILQEYQLREQQQKATTTSLSSVIGGGGSLGGTPIVAHATSSDSASPPTTATLPPSSAGIRDNNNATSNASNTSPTNKTAKDKDDDGDCPLAMTLTEVEAMYEAAATKFIEDRHREILQAYYRLAFSSHPRHYQLYLADEYTGEMESPVGLDSVVSPGFVTLLLKPTPVAQRFLFPRFMRLFFASSSQTSALKRAKLPLDQYQDLEKDQREIEELLSGPVPNIFEQRKYRSGTTSPLVSPEGSVNVPSTADFAEALAHIVLKQHQQQEQNSSPPKSSGPPQHEDTLSRSQSTATATSLSRLVGSPCVSEGGSPLQDGGNNILNSNTSNNTTSANSHETASLGRSPIMEHPTRAASTTGGPDAASAAPSVAPSTVTTVNNSTYKDPCLLSLEGVLSYSPYQPQPPTEASVLSDPAAATLLSPDSILVDFKVAVVQIVQLPVDFLLLAAQVLRDSFQESSGNSNNATGLFLPPGPNHTNSLMTSTSGNKMSGVVLPSSLSQGQQQSSSSLRGPGTGPLYSPPSACTMINCGGMQIPPLLSLGDDGNNNTSAETKDNSLAQSVGVIRVPPTSSSPVLVGAKGPRPRTRHHNHHHHGSQPIPFPRHPYYSLLLQQFTAFARQQQQHQVVQQQLQQTQSASICPDDDVRAQVSASATELHRRQTPNTASTSNYTTVFPQAGLQATNVITTAGLPTTAPESLDSPTGNNALTGGASSSVGGASSYGCILLSGSAPIPSMQASSLYYSSNAGAVAASAAVSSLASHAAVKHYFTEHDLRPLTAGEVQAAAAAVNTGAIAPTMSLSELTETMKKKGGTAANTTVKVSSSESQQQAGGQPYPTGTFVLFPKTSQNSNNNHNYSSSGVLENPTIIVDIIDTPGGGGGSSTVIPTSTTGVTGADSTIFGDTNKHQRQTSAALSSVLLGDVSESSVGEGVSNSKQGTNFSTRSHTRLSTAPLQGIGFDIARKTGGNHSHHHMSTNTAMLAQAFGLKHEHLTGLVMTAVAAANTAATSIHSGDEISSNNSFNEQQRQNTTNKDKGASSVAAQRTQHAVCLPQRASDFGTLLLRRKTSAATTTEVLLHPWSLLQVYYSASQQLQGQSAGSSVGGGPTPSQQSLPSGYPQLAATVWSAAGQHSGNSFGSHHSHYHHHRGDSLGMLMATPQRAGGNTPIDRLINSPHQPQQQGTTSSLTVSHTRGNTVEVLRLTDGTLGATKNWSTTGLDLMGIPENSCSPQHNNAAPTAAFLASMATVAGGGSLGVGNGSLTGLPGRNTGLGLTALSGVTLNNTPMPTVTTMVTMISPGFPALPMTAASAAQATASSASAAAGSTGGGLLTSPGTSISQFNGVSSPLLSSTIGGFAAANIGAVDNSGPPSVPGRIRIINDCVIPNDDVVMYLEIRVKLSPQTAQFYNAGALACEENRKNNAATTVTVRRGIVLPAELTADELEAFVLNEVGLQIDPWKTADENGNSSSRQNNATAGEGAKSKPQLPYLLFIRYGPVLELTVDDRFDFFGAAGAVVGATSLFSPPLAPPGATVNPNNNAVGNILNNSLNKINCLQQQHPTAHDMNALAPDFATALQQQQAAHQANKQALTQSAVNSHLTKLNQAYQTHLHLTNNMISVSPFGIYQGANVPPIRDRTALSLRALGVDTIILDLTTIPEAAMTFEHALPPLLGTTAAMGGATNNNTNTNSLSKKSGSGLGSHSGIDTLAEQSTSNLLTGFTNTNLGTTFGGTPFSAISAGRGVVSNASLGSGACAATSNSGDAVVVTRQKHYPETALEAWMVEQVRFTPLAVYPYADNNVGYDTSYMVEAPPRPSNNGATGVSSMMDHPLLYNSCWLDGTTAMTNEMSRTRTLGGLFGLANVITGAADKVGQTAHDAVYNVNNFINNYFFQSSGVQGGEGATGGSTRGASSKSVMDRHAMLYTRLDEDEARAYQHFDVIKINKYSSRQQRVIGIDGERIYNMRPSSEIGKTKNPERNVADIETIRTFPEKPLYFEIEYKKEVKVDTDCIECRTVADCLLMVEKLKVLKRMNERRPGDVDHQGGRRSYQQSGGTTVSSPRGERGPGHTEEGESRIFKVLGRFGFGGKKNH